MKQKINIAPFLDESGRITQLPVKPKTRLAILEYLSEKFELKCIYSEQQINEICERWNTFGDYYLLRRELIDNNFLCRKRDGSQYWRSYTAEINLE